MDYKLPQMPNRPINSNKGTFGRVLNIAGSKYMPGAAVLSSLSALKIGAGYVELASCKNVLNTVSLYAPEVVLCPLCNLEKSINESSVISIGCGLSTSEEAIKIFETYINLGIKKASVIDADGLNILSKKRYKLSKNIILTPHPKEASRLLNCEVDDILEDTEQSAKKISDTYNCITVLKTYNTIVTDGNSCYKNTSGCSALAKAGSGDILAGIIAGLLAQKMNPFDAASLGVHIHRSAGQLASKDLSEYGVLASDLLNYIPIAIKKYLNNFV